MTIEMTDTRIAVSAASPSHPDTADIAVPQHPLSQRLRAWGLWLVLMGLLAWSWSPAEMFRVTALFTDWRNMAEFGHAFLHPNFHDWDTYLEDMVITIQIAHLGHHARGGVQHSVRDPVLRQCRVRNGWCSRCAA